MKESNNNNWNRENMKTISCRVKNEEAAAFANTAKLLGVAPNELLKTFIRTMNSTVLDKPSDAVVEVLNTCAIERKEMLERMRDLSDALFAATDRAERAEKLVDKWLRSADRKR